MPNPVEELLEVYEDMVEVLLVLEIFLTDREFLGWRSALWCSFLLWSLPVLQRWSLLVASICSVKVYRGFRCIKNSHLLQTCGQWIFLHPTDDPDVCSEATADDLNASSLPFGGHFPLPAQLKSWLLSSTSCCLSVSFFSASSAFLFKALILFQTWSDDPISCYRKPVEWTDESVYPLCSLIRSTGVW